MDGQDAAAVVDAPSGGDKTLGEEFGHQRLAADAVGGQFLLVNIDVNLLALLPVYLDVPHCLDGTQVVAQRIHVVVQLLVGLVLGLDGDQQGRGVAEIIVDHHRQHAGWQLHLEILKPVADFGPDLSLVVHTRFK